jgi:hypothetical protein
MKMPAKIAIQQIARAVAMQVVGIEFFERRIAKLLFASRRGAS